MGVLALLIENKLQASSRPSKDLITHAITKRHMRSTNTAADAMHENIRSLPKASPAAP
jgi:hypothetical protein